MGVFWTLCVALLKVQTFPPKRKYLSSPNVWWVVLLLSFWNNQLYIEFQLIYLCLSQYISKVFDMNNSGTKLLRVWNQYIFNHNQNISVVAGEDVQKEGTRWYQQLMRLLTLILYCLCYHTLLLVCECRCPQMGCLRLKFEFWNYISIYIFFDFQYQM